MEAEHIAKKSGWDARQHFSILLIKLISNIITVSQNDSLLEWEKLLWQYYSLTANFISGKSVDKIIEYRTKLSEFKKTNNIHSGNSYAVSNYNKVAGEVLMKYQELIFKSTSHLLMPVQDDDSDDDFDASKLAKVN